MKAPTLIDNAGEVLKKAWSVRWMAGSFVFAVIEAVVPFFYAEWPPRVAAAVSGLMAAAGFVSRFLSQPEVHGGNKPA